MLKTKIKVEEIKTKEARVEIAETEPTAAIARELKVDQEVTQRAKDMEAFLARRAKEVAEMVGPPPPEPPARRPPSPANWATFLCARFARAHAGTLEEGEGRRRARGR
jgi:hypothetical protein